MILLADLPANIGKEGQGGLSFHTIFTSPIPTFFTHMDLETHFSG